jgi:hypothetical protein
MTEAEILALITGIPAIITAATAFVTALRAKKSANDAHEKIEAIKNGNSDS